MAGIHVTSLKVRTIFAAGDSLVVALPPDWIRGNDLQAGDRVEVWYNGEVHVRLGRKETDSGHE